MANGYSDNLSTFTIDSSTGELSAISGSPFPAGAELYSLTVHPTGQFLYVASEGGGLAPGVSAYRINAATGTLSQIAGSPFATGGEPQAVAITSTGQFLYLADWQKRVFAFSVDAMTGALTSIPGSPFDTAGNAVALDPTTGALSEIAGSPLALAGNPTDVALAPNGQFAYVVDQGEPTLDLQGAYLTVYAIDASSGALSLVPGGHVPTGSSPTAVTIDATGQFLYVANCFCMTAASRRTLSTLPAAFRRRSPVRRTELERFAYRSLRHPGHRCNSLGWDVKSYLDNRSLTVAALYRLFVTTTTYRAATVRER